jgi:hypothetical protein
MALLIFESELDPFFDALILVMLHLCEVNSICEIVTCVCGLCSLHRFITKVKKLLHVLHLLLPSLRKLDSGCYYKRCLCSLFNQLIDQWTEYLSRTLPE